MSQQARTPFTFQDISLIIQVIFSNQINKSDVRQCRNEQNVRNNLFYCCCRNRSDRNNNGLPAENDQFQYVFPNLLLLRFRSQIFGRQIFRIVHQSLADGWWYPRSTGRCKILFRLKGSLLADPG